jgi:hypothetical protein
VSGYNYNTKVDNIGKSFKNMSELRQLRMTVRYEKCIQDEIKRILNSGNACYLSVNNLLSFHLLSKNIKIKIYKIIILLVVLYGCKTWFLMSKGRT